ncbi:MAG: YihY/virulence factor BrkB family protein [Candidatus Dormibacteraceae bacterium]
MLKSFWGTLKETFWAWSEHEAPTRGAALSFYTLLSVAPLVILVVAIASVVFGHSAVQSEFIAQVRSFMGAEAAQAIARVIERGHTPNGVFASVLGVITLLFGASGAFSELHSALNKIWNVQPQAGSGVASLIRSQLLSFGMVLGVGFLLLVSLVITTALAVVGRFFGEILPLPEPVLHTLNFAISFAAIAALFALIFKYVPDARIRWRDVWEGALATALLFTIGKSLIGLYLGKAAVGSAYGAAGSLIVVIVWIYYSAMIFFFGAEFAHVRASERQTFRAGKH